MNNKKFLILFFSILIIGLFLRIFPLFGNNFYFTMDQGNDAVHVREILNRHQVLLTGPETTIQGVFNGPLWFYFLTVGYFLFGGHPAGGVFILILLNIILSAVIMLVTKKKVTPLTALLIGAGLQIFWPFYDTSRYAFNPFPLVSFAVLLIFFLIFAMQGKKKYFIFAAIPVALVFHTELASLPPFFLLYLGTGVLLFMRKKITLLTCVQSLLVFSCFFIPHLISELLTSFSQLQTLQNNTGTISGWQLFPLLTIFFSFIGESVNIQRPLLGLLFFFCILLLAIFRYKKIFALRYHHHSFSFSFLLFTTLLWIISLLWFGSNKGWHPWHTVYLPPLFYISILLIICSFPRKIMLFFISIIFISQTLFFVPQYLHYLKPINDPSVLKNELLAIDWVYAKSKNRGFSVYTYIPSVYDYAYQYLLYWHGKNKYGYVPCEYTTYPGIPDFFVPGEEFYQSPKKSCANLRFLIIEPDMNVQLQTIWLRGARENTTLMEKAIIRGISVEKRQSGGKK